MRNDCCYFQSTAPVVSASTAYERYTNLSRS